MVNLDANLLAIQQKLVTESRLAIVGMSGMGKSTLARALFERIGNTFEYACFCEGQKIEEMNVGQTAHSVDEAFSWDGIKGKRALVVLDGTVSERQVKELTKEDGISKESRLIITARDRGFVERADVAFYIYKVDKLDRGASKELFCLCAFRRKDAPVDFDKDVENVVSRCDGLPLALTVTGKYLYMQGKPVWDDTLKRLDTAESIDGESDDGLWSVLRTSYESLGDTARKCFWMWQLVFTGSIWIKSKAFGKLFSGHSQIWHGKAYWTSTWWKNAMMGRVKGVRVRIEMHGLLRNLGRKIAGMQAQVLVCHTLSD